MGYYSKEERAEVAALREAKSKSTVIYLVRDIDCSQVVGVYDNEEDAEKLLDRLDHTYEITKFNLNQEC